MILERKFFRARAYFSLKTLKIISENLELFTMNAEESEINMLISNIVDEKRYSHCRLCLKSILSDNYAKFEDNIDYTGSNEFIGLTVVLEKLLGPQVRYSYHRISRYRLKRYCLLIFISTSSGFSN